MRGTTRVVVLCAVLVQAGCSIPFTSGPVTATSAVPGSCTDGYALPASDLGSAFAAAAGVVSLDEADVDNVTEARAILGGLAAVYGASSYIGFKRVKACRAALRASWDRLNERVAEELADSTRRRQ